MGGPRLLHQLLRATAEAHPDRVAVVDAGHTIRYAELDAESTGLANLLVRLGIAPGERVGLYLDKSIEAITGLYAVLKAGAVYVPLDPRAPLARLVHIAGDCDVRCLLTTTDRLAACAQLAARGRRPVHVVVLDADEVPAAGLPQGVTVAGWAVRQLRAPQRQAPPPERRISLDVAYILYTSGSTGAPKGVTLTHRNALAFVAWAAREFGVGPGDRLSSHAPLHFDLAVFDVFAAAAGAAALVLVPHRVSMLPFEVTRFMADERITVWYSVPSILNMIARHGGLTAGQLPDLRAVLFAGEVFPSPALAALMRLLPGARFCNLYGPTETNVCTWYEVPAPPAADASIPIGSAIDDVEVFALGDDGRIAGVGDVGELYVRGATVTPGYWRDEELTAQALVRHPGDPSCPDLVYRTGDVVRVAASGEYLFLGRRDGQIKSRGHRIELGDVEAAINAHPAVVECAAVAVPDDLVTNRVIAYVVPSKEVSVPELIRFCAGLLPRYMIPETIHLRPALPRTSTQKIDRHALAGARGRW